ncbi:DoxX family protein [Antrihabitans stalactiti]|uniref:DoxX family protein n=1 Tax=Antrihabitans stalactiti TaxID=2584121 RepID=A0A848KTI8_9NOCA|nr:DoxX family protein [Antrihabitans stalactiti]NMN98867.1 hypothetical protein [Antrihabitans stalactiti]
MEIAAIVCSVALAAGAFTFGIPLTQLRGPLWRLYRSRGISENLARSIGGAEIVGGTGLIVGYWVPLLGLIGCIILGLVFIWATGQRVVYGDYGNPDMRINALLPLGFLLLSILTLVFVITRTGT